jgi:HlyD family secretion protein
MAKAKGYLRYIVLVVLLAAAAGGAWYYFRGKSENAPEYQTTKVSRGDIIQAVTATGDLQPVITVDVSSQISGQIKDVYVDFNSRVKAGDVLARIDPSTYEQRLRQAEAELASAEANSQLVQTNARRQRELFEKNLVSQQEIDAVEAQLAQSNATLLTRRATVEDAKLNLSRCTITAPIDGMVLARLTDKGRTVAASLNAPTLFTLVNDLSKMQINAAVAEADVGVISEGQDVNFTVDAFPSRTFRGSVRQVRNAATTTQSVVSYATIIDVNNQDLRLKPGMTANVSIVVAQKNNVLRVPNGALRARIPAELMPKAPPAPTADGKAAAPVAASPMTEDERRAAMRAILAEAGIQRGSTPTPEAIEKAKKLAEAKGLDVENVTRVIGFMTGAGGGGGFGGGDGQRRNAPSVTLNAVTTRTLYKLTNPDAATKTLVAVSAKLGISDGTQTEVLEGLDENDTVVTAIVVSGATGSPQGAGVQNPFQQNRGFGAPPAGGTRR